MKKTQIDEMFNELRDLINNPNQVIRNQVYILKKKLENYKTGEIDTDILERYEIIQTSSEKISAAVDDFILKYQV